MPFNLMLTSSFCPNRYDFFFLLTQAKCSFMIKYLNCSPMRVALMLKFAKYIGHDHIKLKILESLFN